MACWHQLPAPVNACAALVALWARCFRALWAPCDHPGVLVGTMFIFLPAHLSTPCAPCIGAVPPEHTINPSFSYTPGDVEPKVWMEAVKGCSLSVSPYCIVGMDVILSVGNPVVAQALAKYALWANRPAGRRLLQLRCMR